MNQDTIAVIDLGSARTTDLARAVRALGVYTELHPHDLTAEQLAAIPNLRGIILAAGPRRAFEGQTLDLSQPLRDAGLPTLTVDDADATQPDLDAFIARTGAKRNWNMDNFIADQIEAIRAIGKQLTCVHVNHGLLRQGEPEQVVKVFREELGANLVYVDAVDRFLDKLAGVADPEQKRKIIGAEFIRVFEEEARKLDGIAFLGQGTIYPDIIESGTKTAKAVKSHHNVGGLPEDLQFALVEPLKMLFKDEVRACGLALGLPESMVNRQPFPGPGLGVRCLGAITRDRLDAVRASDAILREEFAAAGLAGKVWQYFTLIPDVRSVGVREGVRAFEWPCVIRAVNTIDAMTATVERLPWPLMERLADRITHEVPGVNRVLFDLTPKPVGTIEWE